MEVIGASKSTEHVREESKIYTGICEVRIVGLNPTIATYQEKVNPNREGEIEYKSTVSTTAQGHDTIILIVLSFCSRNNIIKYLFVEVLYF